MDNSNEADRRLKDEGDGFEDITATVRKAQAFVEQGLMTEAEALKYFNLPKVVYERFKAKTTKHCS